MSTMHDLRVSVRDKMRIIDELERDIKDLRMALHEKESQLNEAKVQLKKRDFIIAGKDSIIREKDMYIIQLENTLRKLNLTRNDTENKSAINSNQRNSDMSIKTQHFLVPPQNGVYDVRSLSHGNGTISNSNKLNNNNNTNNNNTNTNTNANNYSGSNNNNNYHQQHQQPPPIKLSFPNVSSMNKTKRFAISAEPAQGNKKSKDLKVPLKEYPKSEETKELLKRGIIEHEFMKNLEDAQVNAIVGCMHPIEYEKESLIIMEGDVGNLVFIVEEGTVQVIKNSNPICFMGKGKMFGELAILYNCQRTATVRAVTHCKMWAIDRSTFQTIMMRFGMKRQSDYLDLIKNLPFFQGLREDLLMRFVDILDEYEYSNGECIIRQFAKGNTFYIISKGKCKVTKSSSKWDEPQLVKHLNKGDFFGEDALQKEETRPFNVIVDDPNGVTCLVLEREAYTELMNDPEVSNFKREASLKQYRRAQTTCAVVNPEEEELNFVDIRLSEFEILTTLGVGGFGRVELVRNTRDSKTYALKVLKKQHIVAMKQQEHVMNERNILFESKSKYIARLYKTYKNRKYLYMVMEACMGGELWSLLRDKRLFDEQETKFYIACVTEALQYLHEKNILYRDLKPENILIDAKGYCKLVDFGFAKKVPLGKKTWTFCGTPEYVAPEIVLNKGHDLAVDYWSLGILIFELLSGNPPFMGSDPMSTYSAILKGIDAVDFPRQIPKAAAVLVKRLCRENPVERFGYQRGGIKDIQKHKWFEGFSWENFKNGKLEAPFVPHLKSSTDTSNFDSYPEDDGPEPDDDVSGWELGF